MLSVRPVVACTLIAAGLGVYGQIVSGGSCVQHPAIPSSVFGQRLGVAKSGLSLRDASGARWSSERRGEVALVQATEGIFGQPHLFDLHSKSLHFTPTGEPGKYWTEVSDLQWIDDIGDRLQYQDPAWPVGSREVELAFDFPFARRSWRSVVANETGNLTFGFRETGSLRPRFFEYSKIANQIFVTGQPMIAALWRRNNQPGFGTLHVNLSPDLAVFTWEVSEAFANPVHFLHIPRVSRFQIALHISGAIRISLLEVNAEDGVIGIFPGQSPFPEPRLVSSSQEPPKPNVPEYVQLAEGAIHQISSSLLRASLTLRAAPPPPGSGIIYFRVFLDLDPPFTPGGLPFQDADCTLEAIRRPNTPDWEFRACGAPSTGRIDGSAVTIDFAWTSIRQAPRFRWFADAVEGSNYSQMNAVVASLPESTADREVRFSETGGFIQDGAIHESFHHSPLLVPPADLVSGLYRDFDDQFDFLVLYTGIRIDGAEGAATSSGSLSSNIEGIGIDNVDWVDLTGSGGRLQGYQNPSWIDSFVNSESGDSDYTGPFTNHSLAIALTAHELGHRWGIATTTSNPDEFPQLRDSVGHWLEALHAPSAVPRTTPTDSAPMGGRFWRPLEGDEYHDAGSSYFGLAGYSQLELYVMGLLPAEEVQPTFFLESMLQTRWLDGRKVVRGIRREITIDGLLHQMGPRWPDASSSQREFRTGLVLVSPAGHPDIDRQVAEVDAIRQQWEQYWAWSTNGRSMMVTDAPLRSSRLARIVSETPNSLARVGPFVSLLSLSSFRRTDHRRRTARLRSNPPNCPCPSLRAAPTAADAFGSN